MEQYNSTDKLPSANSTNSGGIPTELSIFCVTSVSGIILNIFVLYTVMFGSTRFLRNSEKLLICLSLQTITLCVFLLLYIAGNLKVIDFNGNVSCKAMLFCIHSNVGALALNNVTIIYEQQHKYQPGESFPFRRRLSFILFPALFGSIPAIFNVEYRMDSTKNVGSCKAIKIFGSFGATYTYEIVRFLMYYCTVAVYLLYVLIKNRIKVKHLHILEPILGEKMRSNIQLLRYVFFDSITSIIFWMLLGVILLVCRFFHAELKGSYYIPVLMKATLYITFAYCILKPFIFLLLLGTTPCRTIFCCGFWRREAAIPEVSRFASVLPRTESSPAQQVVSANPPIQTLFESEERNAFMLRNLNWNLEDLLKDASARSLPNDEQFMTPNDRSIYQPTLEFCSGEFGSSPKTQRKAVVSSIEAAFSIATIILFRGTEHHKIRRQI